MVTCICDLRGTSVETYWELRKKLHKWKIQELEDLRIEYNTILARRMSEALKRGIPTENLLRSFPKTKQRYLEALAACGRLGLTPYELHEKRLIWLYSPNEDTTVRVKTISMFLNRLHRCGLAERKTEGRSYRYFITLSGHNRLNYYSKTRDPHREPSATSAY
jgi:hypothetical protein